MVARAWWAICIPLPAKNGGDAPSAKLEVEPSPASGHAMIAAQTADAGGPPEQLPPTSFRRSGDQKERPSLADHLQPLLAENGGGAPVSLLLQPGAVWLARIFQLIKTSTHPIGVVFASQNWLELEQCM